MREHEVYSRYDTKMQDIMSTNVAPSTRRDDPDSHPARQDVDETKLLEIWRELVRQLGASTTSAEHVSAHRGFTDVVNSEPRETDDCYLIWRSYSAGHDYAVGASYSFNPFPVSHGRYTCRSDLVALAHDWEEVRGDMFGAWTALVREDPVVKRLVQKSLEEERATHDEPAS